MTKDTKSIRNSFRLILHFYEPSASATIHKHGLLRHIQGYKCGWKLGIVKELESERKLKNRWNEERWTEHNNIDGASVLLAFLSPAYPQLCANAEDLKIWIDHYLGFSWFFCLYKPYWWSFLIIQYKRIHT